METTTPTRIYTYKNNTTGQLLNSLSDTSPVAGFGAVSYSDDPNYAKATGSYNLDTPYYEGGGQMVQPTTIAAPTGTKYATGTTLYNLTDGSTTTANATTTYGGDWGTSFVAPKPTSASTATNNANMIEIAPGQFVNADYITSDALKQAYAYNPTQAGLTSPTLATNTNLQPKTQLIPPTTNLQPGMTGDGVKQLQDYLVASGYMTQDQVNTGYGIYGPQTTAAVAKLQTTLGVDNSSGVGYYGPLTRTAIQNGATSTTSPTIGYNNLTSTTGTPKLPSAPTSTTNFDTLWKGTGTTGATAEIANYSKMMEDLIKSVQPPQSSVGAYNETLNSPEMQAKEAAYLASQQIVKQKTNELGVLQSQLKAITDAGTAAQLGMESEAGGKDVTSQFLGREQQEISRQTAIKALPLQAQILGAQAAVLAAQGDSQTAQQALQLAQERMGMLFEIKVQDATNLYNYQKEQRDAVYEFATTQQQLLLDAQQKVDDRNFVLYQDNVSYARQLANAAIEYGQGALAGQIANLNPSSSTFQQQLSALAAKIVKPQTSDALSPAQINTTINQIAGSFDNEQIVKDYNVILAKKLSVDKILDAGLGGPGDLATVYEFMKALDPTSVVRETEYATAAKSGNIFQGALAQFNGYFNPNGGFLPQNVKDSFQSIVNSKLQVQQQLYQNLYNQYQQRIEQAKTGGGNSLTDYSTAYQPTTNTSSGGLYDW